MMPGRGFLLSQGALVSGISVHPRHLPLLGQVVLEWGIVGVVGDLCKAKYKSFLI